MTEFHGRTDQITRIQLQSYMLECFWGLAEVAAGGTVPLEVRTAYVADSSDIKITVKDAFGGTVDIIKGKVYSNYFRTQYPVKPNNSGGIFFEADMNAHGLKRVSGAIKVLPPVKMSGFKMEDGDGNPIKEITNQESIKMSVKMTGPKDGTEAKVNLYLQTEKNQRTTAYSTTTKVKNGMVECIWNQKYPMDQKHKKSQAEIRKDGETYFVPEYFFGVTCLGTEAFSDPVEYSSWITLNFGNVRGKVTYELPDGTGKTDDIPDDGLLKLNKVKVGKLTIKKVSPE